MAKQKKEKNLEAKISRVERNERLTNWYMINLCWGILGILVLIYLRGCYVNASVLVHMNLINYILTGVFAATAIVLFVLGKIGKIKNAKRAYNYGTFSIVCGVVTLWLALYNKLRPLIEKLAQLITGNNALHITSYWNIRIPLIGIIAYLVVAFVWYLIKVSRK